MAEQKALSLGALKDIDMGKIDVVFRRALEQVARDCADRPGDKSSRKVRLEVEIKPAADESGVCNFVDVGFTITSKVPAFRTRDYEMRLNYQGTFFFNPDSPDDVQQETMNFKPQQEEE